MGGGSGHRWLRLCLIGLSTCLWASEGHLSAHIWQSYQFIESLRGTSYNLKVVGEGLESVTSIDFDDSKNPQYRSFFNSLILSESTTDDKKAISRLDNLGPTDLGTIVHESFHAFKANFIDSVPSMKPLKLWMKQRAAVVYPNLPAAKRETALEEAYAVFIESTIVAHENVVRTLRRESKHCEANKIFAQDIWRQNWASKVIGYYYRDSIAEYWSDKVTGLMRRIFSDDLGPTESAIYDQRGIGPIDKSWIATNILENRFVASFENTFGDEDNLLACRL
jgi:hypothetical protein